MKIDLHEYSEIIKKNGLLEFLLDRFWILGFLVTVGLEIEFFSDSNLDYIQLSKDLGLEFTLVPERGKNQYEIVTQPYILANLSAKAAFISEKLKHTNVMNINHFIKNCNDIILNLKNNGFNLAPKPYHNDYGNGLHINLSFFDIYRKSYVNRKGLKHLAHSICKSSEDNLWIFLNRKVDLDRISSNKFMSPTHICYGVNNRNCLIRLTGEDLHILEYRLGSNNLDLRLGIYSLLFKAFNHLKDSSNEFSKCKLGTSHKDSYELFGFPNDKVPIIPKDLKILKSLFNLDLRPWLI